MSFQECHKCKKSFKFAEMTRLTDNKTFLCPQCFKDYTEKQKNQGHEQRFLLPPHRP